MAVTDNPKIQAPFNETPNVEFVPFNDLAAVEQKLATKEFAAVIIEGIQGVGGIQVPDDQFMRDLRALTKKYGTLLILDEIQSGYGRTGKFFAHQYAGIEADLISVAKGIANGFPMAALLIAPFFDPRIGMLGTTFGGNHLACAAALSVLDVIESEHLIDNAAEMGAYLITELKKIKQLKDVRGRGLMIGVDVEGSGAEMRKRLIFDKHIFTGGAGQSTVRLLPALCFSKAQADQFLTAFKDLVEK